MITVPFVAGGPRSHVPGCIVQNMLTLRAALIEHPTLTPAQLERLVTCPCSTVDQLLWLGRRLCIIPRGALA